MIHLETEANPTRPLLNNGADTATQLRLLIPRIIFEGRANNGAEISNAKAQRGPKARNSAAVDSLGSFAGSDRMELIREAAVVDAKKGEEPTGASHIHRRGYTSIVWIVRLDIRRHQLDDWL